MFKRAFVRIRYSLRVVVWGLEIFEIGTGE